jgi:ankyrin repeat protein
MLKWDLDRLLDDDAVSHTSALSIAMISAIEKRQHEEVKRLVESGEDPWAKDGSEWCAFHHAVRAGSERVMRQLLHSKKVKGREGVLEQRNKDGATPLHFASSTGMIKMAKALLDAGADKDAVDRHNRSPIFVAVHHIKYDMVELLWNHGASFTPSRPDRFKSMEPTLLTRKNIVGKTKKG